MPFPTLALPLHENDPSRHAPHVFDELTRLELISQLAVMKTEAIEAQLKSLHNNENVLFGEVKNNADRFAKALPSIFTHGERVVEADALEKVPPDDPELCVEADALEKVPPDPELWKHYTDWSPYTYPELCIDRASIWYGKWSKKPFPFYVKLFMSLHHKIVNVLNNPKSSVFEGSWKALVSILSMIVWLVLRILNEDEGVLLDCETTRRIPNKRGLEDLTRRASRAIQQMSNRHIQIVQRQLDNALNRLNAIKGRLGEDVELPALNDLIVALAEKFPDSDGTNAISTLQRNQEKMVKTQTSVLGHAVNFVNEWSQLVGNASDMTTLSVFIKIDRIVPISEIDRIVPILRNVCAVQLLPGHEPVVDAFDEAVKLLDSVAAYRWFPDPRSGDGRQFSGRRGQSGLIQTHRC